MGPRRHPHRVGHAAVGKSVTSGGPTPREDDENPLGADSVFWVNICCGRSWSDCVCEEKVPFDDVWAFANEPLDDVYVHPHCLNKCSLTGTAMCPPYRVWLLDRFKHEDDLHYEGAQIVSDCEAFTEIPIIQDW